MLYTEEEDKSQSAHLLAEIQKSSVWLGVPRVDSKTYSREAGNEFLKKVLTCDNTVKEEGDFDCSTGVERDNKKSNLSNQIKRFQGPYVSSFMQEP